MKTKLSTVALSGALFLSGAISAEGIDNMRVYLGVDGAYNHYGYTVALKDQQDDYVSSKDKSRKLGAGAFVGIKFNDNLGAELGVQRIGKLTTLNRDDNNRLTLTSFNYYFDVNGYLPVTAEFNLMAGLGLGRLRTKQEGTLARSPAALAANIEDQSKRSTKTGIRLNVGGQYNFTDNIATRLNFVYQKAGESTESVKSMTAARLALLYMA